MAISEGLRKAGGDAHPTKDCTTCSLWVGFNNNRRGIRIPHPAPPPKFGYGKCTRKEGHCSPHKVRW
jgi:hypothetical protein